jgi:hypothetical protein
LYIGANIFALPLDESAQAFQVWRAVAQPRHSKAAECGAAREPKPRRSFAAFFDLPSAARLSHISPKSCYAVSWWAGVV